MRFVESRYAGKRCWMIDSWRDDGFTHAFFGAELDVRSDRRAFEELASHGAPFFKLRTLRQVHGVTVIEAGSAAAEEASDPEAGEPPEGDGWFVDLETRTLSGVAYGIRSADCIPVLLRARSAPFASCVHSGWRGSVGQVVSAAVRCFEARGVKASDLEVAIGPAARGCCYEIGAELVPVFQRCFAEYQSITEQPLEMPLRETAESIYVDSSILVRAELLARGVDADRIAIFEGCTICDDRFFSFRREKELSGRQVSVIGRARDAK